MLVLPGMCRDEDDDIWAPPFNTGSNFLTAWQIFEDGGTPEENERCWVELTEAPGYFLNDHGEVYSCHSGKYLKVQSLDRSNHMGYKPYVNGEQLYLYRDRLLGIYFKENPNNLPVLRHLDDDRNNCDLDNLEWGTQKDNMYDCIRNGNAYFLTDEDREKGFEKVRIPVKCLNLEIGALCHFRSQADAARELGLQQANVWKVLNGKRKSTCGWYFEYDR